MTDVQAQAQTFETLLYGVEDGIALITLNRPDKMNSFTTQMMLDLIAAFDAVDADDEVKVVIVTGAGERAFCAGADLSSGGNTFNYKERGIAAREEAKVGDVYRDGGGRVVLRIFECRKPVIAAVNGAAVGVGVTMQLPMDIRLASTTARFGFVFARRGITPEACSSWFLPRLVGPQQALEWVYTGRVFGAEEALKGGLVRSLHDPEDLLPAAMALGKEIVENSAPVSVALSRRLIYAMMGAEHPMEAHKADSRAIQARGQSADAQEGIAAFLEKRAPSWPDKISDGLPELFPFGEERPFR